ncbi:MAG: hypothetical protein Q9222_003344 [Ikaeria aurantiellina]
MASLDGQSNGHVGQQLTPYSKIDEATNRFVLDIKGTMDVASIFGHLKQLDAHVDHIRGLIRFIRSRRKQLRKWAGKSGWTKVNVQMAKMQCLEWNGLVAKLVSLIKNILEVSRDTLALREWAVYHDIIFDSGYAVFMRTHELRQDPPIAEGDLACAYTTWLSALDALHSRIYFFFEIFSRMNPSVDFELMVEEIRKGQQVLRTKPCSDDEHDELVK